MPEPADEILAKAILPTGLSSEEIRRTVSPEIRRRSFFSARTAEAEYLEAARRVCADVAAGRIGTARARELLAEALRRFGYAGDAGAPGAIDDIGSEERLNLIIDTQRDMAHSVALLDAQTDVEIAMFPAWRLVRFGTRRDPRDWGVRWAQAAQSVNWDGCARNGDFVALKSSPVWGALGAGVGGHRDTLGNPYPPFAFNSGMDWEAVDAEECARLGLSVDVAKKPRRKGLDPDAEDFKRARKKMGEGEFDAMMAELEGGA
jgi:hypothetical protein